MNYLRPTTNELITFPFIQTKEDDFNPKYYLKLLRTKYSAKEFNELECEVCRILQFGLDYPTVYDFVIYHLEMLLLKIKDEKARKYYQSIYCKPHILMKIFEIVDYILLDIQSVNFKPSLIASCLLKHCFGFEHWQNGLINLRTNKNNRYNLGYIPRLMTPTPTPTPSPFGLLLTPSPGANAIGMNNNGCYAKLGGQVTMDDINWDKCNKLVNKYLNIDMFYWRLPPNIFDFKKELTNNILTYQTWRAIQ